MSFVKYVQSLAWFLSHSSWDEFLCFAACLWLRCIGWPRFTPQSVQVLKLEAPISVFRLSPGVGSLPVVAPCVWRMGCHLRGLRNITVISCPVSTDGPDYVSLRTQPSVFDAVLTAVTGASVQSECACFSRPEPTHVHWIHHGSLLGSQRRAGASSVWPGSKWETTVSCGGPRDPAGLLQEVTIQRPHECNHRALQTF